MNLKVMNTESQNLNPSSETESGKYLRGIRECSRTVIEEIYRKYSKDIERMIVQNSGTADDAKDVFQEVMISLYRQAHAGLEIRCSFYTFLSLACKKRWLTQLSSKHMSKTQYGEDTLPNIVSISEEVNVMLREDDRMKLMMEKLKMMNDGCREVIEMSWQTDKDGKHLGWQEIAGILDVSYAYIRKKASECKSRLIELVRKDYRYYELING